jgi:DNA-binding SARP family transcriptional activator/tetratricopeptide (TPR) repeat protein
VELRVLGDVEVWVEGERVEVGHARQRCVLAVLACDANRVVTVPQLLERGWDGPLPHRARQVVAGYVSRLRRVLGGENGLIERRSGGYVLVVDPESVDLHRFRRLVALARDEDDAERSLDFLEQASALWRGEAFSGLDTPWLNSVRQGVERERFAVDLDRIDLLLERGRHAALLPELAALSEAHPLDERVAGQFMLALYRCGRQAEALARYERVRARLAEELGADPGQALRELHQRMLVTDPALVVKAPVEEVPRQLPAPPRAFTGRSAELDRLDRSLGGTALVSAIGGAGGIGKTWLVLQWAHRNLDRFPDGQLFVDLRGFSPDSEPMDPAVAVRGFLDALGASRVPVEPHAQAALFRGLVADRRMLIVLDNAADTNQVVPLLPGGQSCTVLVTSRTRLSGLVTGHGAHHFALDVLTDDEAHDLLAARLGLKRIRAEPGSVVELIRLCGGFPLALSIIAGRAQAHPDLSLAAPAAELREAGLEALDDGDPVASLPAVLSWSYHALTDEQAMAFGLLGIAPGPDISPEAAACLIGLPVARTRTLLRALEQASLLSRDAHGRYGMHDLIRRYATDTARQDLSEEVRQAALRRVVDHYLHTAHSADRLLLPRHEPSVQLDGSAQPLPDRTAALSWLDAEHACLLAAQHTAASTGRHAVVWQLASTLTTFHRGRGHFDDAMAVWRAGLAAAEQLDDPVARIEAHRSLGGTYAAMGRYDDALDHLGRALALAEATGDRLSQLHVHRGLSNAWTRGKDDRQALVHATRALELSRAIGDQIWEGHMLNQVGWLTAQLGSFDRARAHCLAALSLARTNNDPDCVANTLDSLGYIDHHTGHHERAVSHYRRSLTLLYDLGDLYLAAEALDYLGHPYVALGRLSEARDVWLQALELFRAQRRGADVERVSRQLDQL